MLTTTLNSAANLPLFIAYFLAAVFFLFLFCWIYTHITPYNEIKLIRSGNTSAAIAFSGAVLGYAMPLASVIAHSVSLLDMAIWSGIALLVQIMAFGVARLLLPNIRKDIPGNRTAAAVLIGVMSFAAGLINAACMTY